MAPQECSPLGLGGITASPSVITLNKTEPNLTTPVVGRGKNAGLLI